MTSRNPLLPDNSVLTSAASTGMAGVWGKMDTSALIGKPTVFDMTTLMPDYSKMMEPLALQVSKSVASFISATYTDQLASIQKSILRASGVNNISKMFLDSHNAMLRGMFPPISLVTSLGLSEQFQSPISAITKSLAASIDTSYVDSILASAVTFRDQLAEEDLEDLTDDFLENHPDLAESIEELPALYTLSKTDRALVVWFVRICVTMTVACVLLNIEAEFPEVQRFIDVLGIGGGLAAGKKAGDVTEKVLDRLPQEEAQ